MSDQLLKWTATYENCKENHIQKFKLKEIVYKNGDYLPSIDYDIENFYIKSSCQSFIYMNLKRLITKEEIKNYYLSYKKNYNL